MNSTDASSLELRRCVYYPSAEQWGWEQGPLAQGDTAKTLLFMPHFSSCQELNNIEPPYAGGNLECFQRSLSV